MMKTSIKFRFSLIFDQRSTQKFAFANLVMQTLAFVRKILIFLCIKNPDIKFAIKLTVYKFLT